MKAVSRIDLFRYGIISSIIMQDEVSVRKECSKLAGETYFYNGKNYKFSEETIRKWYYKYKNEGFDKLNKKIREDCTKSRKLKEEEIEYILDLKGKYPKITTKKIYDILKKDNYLKDISIDSLYRYMKLNHIEKTVVTSKERRRYEKENPNDTWQADTTYGPYILIEGKKYRTYLIQFIDDNSRLVVGYGFFLNDNAKNVQIVFKRAIKKYGVPKQIYLDNGKSYKNNQLEIICARMAVKLTHTHAYDPQAKGKVERCFKTIKEGWMYAKDWNKFKTIEEMESNYGKYLYSEYINKIHSEIEDTPNNVWHKGIINTKHRKIEDEKLEEIFMHEESRKVSSDRTISFNNKLYEVPYKYVGTTVTIRYYVDKLEELWVYEKSERKEKCKLLNKVDNSKVMRKSNIDYSKMVNKEEDVIEMEEE